MESLSREESEAILKRNEIGRLGCFSPSANATYVVPISYEYAHGAVFFACLPGLKLAYLVEHPEGVCLEVEEVDAEQNWDTVLVIGTYTRLTGHEQLLRWLPAIGRVGRGPLRTLFHAQAAAASGAELVLCALRPTSISGRRDRWMPQQPQPPAAQREARAELAQKRH
ncbi:MAG TPA: pyridoxamine 5'-phosphate oxidase family protein, partial [Chloroflexota bacterium]|nr:pyridoxamine 5'-phosphate oxidase family protein [Chloroflexota bacterium]